MCRALAAAIGMLFVLLLSPQPAAAQCCQFQNGCTETNAQLCRREGGRPTLGICMTGRCRIVGVPSAGPRTCCQFRNGGCSDTFTVKGCESVGGIPAVGRRCTGDGNCRR